MYYTVNDKSSNLAQYTFNIIIQVFSNDAIIHFSHHSFQWHPWCIDIYMMPLLELWWNPLKGSTIGLSNRLQNLSNINWEWVQTALICSNKNVKKRASLSPLHPSPPEMREPWERLLKAFMVLLLCWSRSVSSFSTKHLKIRTIVFIPVLGTRGKPSWNQTFEQDLEQTSANDMLMASSV